MSGLTAKKFIEELKSNQSESEREKIRRYYKMDDPDNQVIGVRMKHTFDLSKKYAEMPVEEIENLLEYPYYEARMGAVSIMDYQVRKKGITEDHRRTLFELYLRKHDRLNNWDFMDRAAPRVIGSYLYDYKKSREVLYQLAQSGNPWERRTSIVSTAWFILKNETDDTFQIAKILLNDEQEFVQKAIGTWVRHAGKQNQKKLLTFLDDHAAEMERKTLTIAMENLTEEQKRYFRNK